MVRPGLVLAASRVFLIEWVKLWLLSYPASAVLGPRELVNAKNSKNTEYKS
jgi:hypothetical protein